MEVSKQTGLIRTRRAAVATLCLTAYVAAQQVWELFNPPREHFHWLMFDTPPDFGLPTWAIAAINLAFYAGAIWCFINLYRASQGKERIVVAGWAISLVAFIRPLLPGDLAIPVRYGQAAGMIAAIIAAAYLALETPPNPALAGPSTVLRSEDLH